MLNTNSKTNIWAAVLILVAACGVGYFLIHNKVEDKWKTYTNPVHNYSFEYPSSGYRVNDSDPSGEGNGADGQFGSGVISDNKGEVFVVDVISLGVSDLGLKNLIEEGKDVKQIAQLSREVNLKPEENFSLKKVGELKPFNFKNGTGYGFTITNTFDWCFDPDVQCDSGEVLTFIPPYDKFWTPGPRTIVYVADRGKIYRIKFPTDSIGPKVFSSFTLGTPPNFETISDTPNGKLYSNSQYGVEFQYPNSESQLKVDLVQGPGGLDSIIRDMGNTKWNPYGKNPKISSLKVQGQNARIIASQISQNASIVILLPKPITLDIEGFEPPDTTYSYVQVDCSKDSIGQIISTFKFTK